MTSLAGGSIGATSTGREPARGRPITGRDRELATLQAALEEAAAGRGRTVLVTGEAGIGKTTLIETFTGAAKDQDARVVWGHCWEAGGAPAYWPWVQALRAALAMPGVSAEVEPVRSYLDVVATLIPEVAGPGSREKPSSIEGDHERFALFDAISRVIQAIGSERPFVVVLEDLHAADVSSLLLLKFVARDVRTSRCLVIGAFREGEIENDPAAREMLAEVARESESITLTGLDTTSFDRLLTETSGVPPSDALVNSLHQITDGNPFYATEIVRLLLREGKIEPRLDLTRRGLPVPEGVSETVLKRVRALPPEVQATLKAGAVIGREFRIPPLVAASGVALVETRARLRIAEDERVIRPSSSGTYVFDHGLIREALYESLPDKERASLHGRVAAALEADGVDSSGENLTEIAHHYLRAALDDARPPFDYAVRAASRALDVFAFEQAIDLFEEALALAPVVGGSPDERSDVLRGLGEALLRSGRVTEAKGRLREAADEAKASGSPERLAAAVITYGYSPVEGGIVNHEHIQLIQDALASLPPEPSRERALLLARRAHELMLSGKKEDLEPRDRMGSEALEMIRRFGDERDVARVLRHRFSVILAPDRLEECMALADEILKIGLSLKDVEIQVIGRMRRGAVFMAQGRAAEVDAEFIAIQRLVGELRQPLYASPVAFFKACLTGMRSTMDAAAKESDAALAVGSDVPNAMGAHLLQHICWRWQTDGAGDFEPFMRAAMEQRPGIRRTWGAGIAATLARVNRREEAAALLHDIIEDLPNAPVDSAYMPLLHCATEAVRVLRAPDGAEALYDALLPYRDQHALQVMVAPVMYYGSAEWALGTLASVMERWDAAEEHLSRALAEHTRMGARAYLAWTESELADVLFRRGTAADAPRARSLLDESLRSSEELGLQILRDFATQVLESTTTAGQEAPSEGAAIPDHGAMIKEGDYVTVTYGAEVVRLRHSKGLDYLAALLAHPGSEMHVLEISGAGPASTIAGAGELELASDDIGAALDPKAKAAYKQRIGELRADIEEAESMNDLVRTADRREELAFLTEQLASAVGLGGRDRKTGSNAERARVNVTKRIKTTINKLASGAPKLGRHLEATVKTGVFLSYSDRIEPTLEWDIRLSDGS